jgi:tRNA pseudouridine38-40 synthase
VSPSTLLRVRLDLGYDGSGFSGWAAQPGRRTVQGVLGAALAQVLRLPDPPPVVVAGRTDAGVHARGQVCHVDLPEDAWRAAPGRSTDPPAQALRRRLAGILPADVRVVGVAEAPTGFDARFSAIWRRYAYRVCDQPAGPPPLRRHDVLAHRGLLDVQAMNIGCTPLLGLQDFAAFCRQRQGATTVRTLKEYSWSRRATDDGELVIARVVADAFCHSMVRALVGGALAVGSGRREPAWLGDVLAGGSRDPGVVVVPPHGLVLEEVGYPPEDELSARAQQARAVRDLPGM